MIDKASLMTKAIQIREKLGADSNSPLEIFSIVQNINNLTLVYYPMGQTISGICIKGGSGNCVIAINSAMSLGRQRFSLAHELYHLFYDSNMSSVCGKKIGIGKEIEKEADIFASYFLMPAAEAENKAAMLASKHENNKLTLDDVIRIEQYFCISHQAAVIRLKESPYMDTALAESFMMSSVRKRAEMMGYSADLYCPLPVERQYKTVGNYIDQANQLLQQDLISEGKYEELLLDAFRPDIVFGEEEGCDVLD